MLPTDGYLLRIFVGENDRYERKPVYEWVVLKARELGLAGATVLRGIEGFGAASTIHTASILRLSQDLPIVIEIVDIKERIDTLLAEIEPAIEGGMATLEKVQVLFYRHTREDK